VAPSNGRLAGAVGTVPDKSNLQVSGGGNLYINAGEDIKSGLYFVGKGQGRLRADGNFSQAANAKTATLLALGDGQLDLRARGDLAVEWFLDPHVLPQVSANATGVNRSSFYSLTDDSAVNLYSVAGKTEILAREGNIKNINPRFNFTDFPESLRLLPSVLRLHAFSSDVALENKNLVLRPSSKGTFEVLADGSVTLSNSSVVIPDFDDALLPSATKPFSLGGLPNGSQIPTSPSTLFPIGLTKSSPSLFGTAQVRQGEIFHRKEPLHQADAEPVRVVARQGDVSSNLDTNVIFSDKPVWVEAGRDIVNFGVSVQHTHENQSSRFRAGRDIRYDTIGAGDFGFVLGGPGRVEVIAGRHVDFGASNGIVTEGNAKNPYLPEKGASLMVASGTAAAQDYSAFIVRYLEQADTLYLKDLLAYVLAHDSANPDLQTPDEAANQQAALAVFKKWNGNAQTEFINRVFYSELKGSAMESAQSKDYSRGDEAVALRFPNVHDGDIRLFASQLKTIQGGDVEMLSPGGQVVAGLAAGLGPLGIDKGAKGDKDDASYLGIVTVAGGAIQSFSKGDFLVNSSRAFTLQGGDILLWSNEGDVDAGRGAKTASATPPAKLRRSGEDIVFDVTQSVAGSGIGTLKANADVIPGDTYLVAPRGVINAGEAGIRSLGNLTIAAQAVVGADNIQVSGTSVGVPSSDASSLSSSVAGAGDSTAKSGDESVKSIGQDDDKALSTLDVEVLSFGAATETGPASTGEQKKDREQE
jgi:hypothetical protein